MISFVDHTSSNEPIEWTQPMLERFKKAYARQEKLLRGPESVFRFEGHEYVMSYAYYLIQHLESKFGTKDK